MKIYYGLNYRKIKRWLRQHFSVIFMGLIFFTIYGIVGTMEIKSCLNGGICP